MSIDTRGISPDVLQSSGSLEMYFFPILYWFCSCQSDGGGERRQTEAELWLGGHCGGEGREKRRSEETVQMERRDQVRNVEDHQII